MSIEGADRLARRFDELPEKLRAKMERAVHRNGEEWVSGSRIVIPVRSGESKRAIKGTPLDMAYECDFGPKAKVIEGENGPRPFLNRVKSARQKKWKRRYKYALTAAVKGLADE